MHGSWVWTRTKRGLRFGSLDPTRGTCVRTKTKRVWDFEALTPRVESGPGPRRKGSEILKPWPQQWAYFYRRDWRIATCTSLLLFCLHYEYHPLRELRSVSSISSNEKCSDLRMAGFVSMVRIGMQRWDEWNDDLKEENDFIAVKSDLCLMPELSGVIIYYTYLKFNGHLLL